ARWPYAAAAALALALGLGYALLRPGPEHVAPPIPQPPATTARIEPEQPPATTPPPAIPQLAWSATSPAAGEPAKVKEGQRLHFEAAVAQAGGLPRVELRWSPDGRGGGRGG